MSILVGGVQQNTSIASMQSLADEVSRARSVLILSVMSSLGSQTRDHLAKAICLGLGSTIIFLGVGIEVMRLIETIKKAGDSWEKRDLAQLGAHLLVLTTSLILVAAKVGVLGLSVRVLMQGFSSTDLCSDVSKSGAQSLFNADNLNVFIKA